MLLINSQQRERKKARENNSERKKYRDISHAKYIPAERVEAPPPGVVGPGVVAGTSLLHLNQALVLSVHDVVTHFI